MDIATALLFNLVIGVAAFMSSLTGFGYALVATPFLVLLFPPQLVVPVVLISWVPLATLVAREAKGKMHIFSYCSSSSLYEYMFPLSSMIYS